MLRSEEPEKSRRVCPPLDGLQPVEGVAVVEPVPAAWRTLVEIGVLDVG